MTQNPVHNSPFPAYRARVLRVLAQQKTDLPLIHQIALRLAERLADLNRPTAPFLGISLAPHLLQATLPASQQLVEVTPAQGLLSNLWLTVQEDPALWLHTHLKTLPPDSPLLATTLGSQTMQELFAAWHAANLPARTTPLPLPDVQAAGSLLQRLKLALPVVDRDTITLTFPTLHSLLQTLKAHGALVSFLPQNKSLLTRRQLHRLEVTYRTLYPRPDNRLPLTLEVLYLHGFTPAASQPTAAKRGSGKALSFVRITPPDET